MINLITVQKKRRVDEDLLAGEQRNSNLQE